MDADEFRRAWRDARVQEGVEQFKMLARRILIPGTIGLLGLIVVFSSFYTVQPDEVGVVTRFGAFARETDPGLHFKLPWGIEDVHLVQTQRVLKEEFGFRTLQADVRTQYSREGFENESLMLTGDLNIADVEWIVQYRIKDAENYLFKMRDPTKALRDASESVMRLVVGDHSVTEVLTSGRRQVNVEVMLELQRVLDHYGSGIEVVQVKLQDVHPPASVVAAFNEVNQAKQEKEQTITQAWEQYNSSIPAARGQAEETIARAEGTAIERVNRAEGEVQRFNDILAEYQLAPAVTRQRLYLETMREVLPQVQNKILTDGASGSGLLPLLHLGQGGAGR